MKNVHLNEHSDGRWSLRIRDASNKAATAGFAAQSRERGRAFVWELAKQVGRSKDIVQLELLKAVCGDNEQKVGAAECVFDVVAGGEGGGKANLTVNKRLVCSDALYAAARRRGVGLRAIWWHTFARQIRAWASIIVGLALGLLWAVEAHRYRTRRGAALELGQCIGLHAEVSNRTRHLFHLVSKDGEQARDVLLLGRKLAELPQLARALEAAGRGRLPRMVVPFSWASLLDAAMPTIRSVPELVRAIVQAPVGLNLRQAAPMAARVMVGEIQSAWLHRHVVMQEGAQLTLGHTGTGDATSLELAFQTLGGESVHILHGVCTGPNMLGFSNAAYFRCGFDSRRYWGTAAYGNCLAASVDRHPQAVPAHQEYLLLLTNLAHPMNPEYQATGVAAELNTLRVVMMLAEQASAGPVAIRWKPHPVFSRLPSSQQAELREYAQMHKIDMVDVSTDVRRLALYARVVITHPSSVVVDLLASGYPAIVFDPTQAALDDVAGAVTGYCRSFDELRAQFFLRWNATMQEVCEIHRSDWQRVQPSQSFSGHLPK